MSSRKSTFNEEGSPSSRCGARTPLRCLQNDVLHLSSPPWPKTKLQLSTDTVKSTKADARLCDPEPDLHSAQTACDPGDVTFKSFVCAGGEVVVPGASLYAEDSIILPKDQASEDAGETEDTVISDSMNAEPHIEHPYHTPEVRDAPSFSADAHTARVSEVSSAVLPSEDSEEKQVARGLGALQRDDCSERDVTFKSFTCDGGEVELSDVTRLPDESVPLPATGVVDLFHCSSVDSSHFSDQLCQADHADHPYCNAGSDAAPLVAHLTACETANVSGEVVDRQNDVTRQSFNGTGSQIEVSDGTKPERIPLPTDQTAVGAASHNDGVNSSVLASEECIQNSSDSSDRPHCITENSLSSSRGNLPTAEEPSPGSSKAVSESERSSLSVAGGHVGRRQDDSVSGTGGEAERREGVKLSEDTNPPVHHSVHARVIQEHGKQLGYSDKDEEAVVNTESPSVVSLKDMEGDCISGQPKEETPSNTSNTPTLLQEPPEVASSSEASESCGTKDSALGSSGDGQHEGNLADVLKGLMELPSVAEALQFEILSPVVQSAPLSAIQSGKGSALGEDSALEGTKMEPNVLWTGAFDSPIPRPLFNSTELVSRYSNKPPPGPAAEPAEGAVAGTTPPALDVPVIGDGPLQQQLRQMAEFLILASGKMVTTAVCAPAPPPVASTPAPAKPTPRESHNACVGTSPVKMVDHSLNTSGRFERVKDLSLADACTATEPLLWNVPPGSLECLPRDELEQRLRSSMIMVEALVQQLSAARTHVSPAAGPAPSQLRDKLVQTQHSELNRTTMYRDLYMAALGRIDELELEESSLQSLVQQMQDTRTAMTALSCDTDAALSNMKQIGHVVREDQRSLLSQRGRMKSLFEKSKETQGKMMQKVRDAFQERADMKTQMDEAVAAEQAAFSAMDQLRLYSATHISQLEQSLGSQQELLEALNQAYPEQVALKKTHAEVLNSAADLLSKTMDEHSALMEELRTARILLQKTSPTLLKLNEKAAAALRERDQHVCARDRAVEEREQMQEELDGVSLSLQDARQQIDDLNLQATIMTSEMGVLREKLSESDDERAQLERKVTALSATVSSTLASYTFLEHSLAAETTKSQQSRKDTQQANHRADELEGSLSECQQQAGELSQALADSKEKLVQLEAHCRSQNLQLQQLHNVCTQLSAARETNEFLQMENDVVREQVSENEGMLRANLQALRERNIECEDLRRELAQFQVDNKALGQELETTRSSANATQLDLGGALAQVVFDMTSLHHTLQELDTELQRTLTDQKAEPPKGAECQPVSCERRHPSRSFLDSVMVALTAENGEDMKTETSAGEDVPEPQCDGMFSETSAFTRIAAVTPKKASKEADGEFEPEEQQQQSDVAALLADLSSTVTRLVCTVTMVQQRKDAQLDERHNTVSGLQEEQRSAGRRHKAEVKELERRLERLNSQVEKGNQALQHKAQDEKTMSKLMTDVSEAQELLNKLKADNTALQREVAELRRALQQARTESQILHKELEKAGGHSANPAQVINDKINLLKEVDKLKGSVQEMEQARTKLLDRAKRHQIIYQTNQQKTEDELRMLDKMLRRVRETLISVPHIVKDCAELRLLADYIG
ncbi:sperm-associated antigen 5 [Genypterus blacodes]|uniref:sperm-associated antigen 5 n=1 Tax=Genypterus blacodes TaxID=154954 RepID=UPI003F777A72